MGGGPGRDDSYFTESRKGEVNELRQLLRGFGTERDKQRKRDIMKKVIAYMTLGIDVSRLFTEMMLAIESELLCKAVIYCSYTFLIGIRLLWYDILILLLTVYK